MEVRYFVAIQITLSTLIFQTPASVVSAVASSTVRKGLLWQQRDKIFSRWKERFFILTEDYLQCFKRGTSRITEMGAFIFKIKLVEVRNYGYQYQGCQMAKFDPVLSLDCVRMEGVGAQSKERKGSNFAA